MGDKELLSRFIEHRDADAFRLIVDRYIAVVYAAARRQTGSDHLAEDVTQAVFMMLSQRAHRVKSGAVLAGWLVNATRFAAKTAARGERRRQLREQKVVRMTPPPMTDTPTHAPHDPALLDEALARLRHKDRTAVTLRYLKGMSTEQVASTMGISTDAAEKRVSRAVGKLRSHYHRRGVTFSAIGMTTLLTSAARVVPAGLGQRTLAAALISTSAAPTTAAVAALIAKGAIMSMKVKAFVTVSVAVALLALVIGSVVVITSQTPRKSPPTLNALATISETAEPIAASEFSRLYPNVKPPIKVGIILSDMTASALTNGKPFGYKNQLYNMLQLQHPDIQLYPVIEPGTDASPELARTLSDNFPNKTPVNGYDPESIKQMDLIMGAQVWYLRGPMIHAITSAVNDGVGLIIRQGFGDISPGYNAELLHLHGMQSAEIGENIPWKLQVPSEIVGENPILGRLSGKIGADVVDVLPHGTMGVFTEGAVPLIRVKDVQQVNPRPIAIREKWDFYPLYTARLGRGGIIVCNFNVLNQPPAELEDATDHMFTIHCAYWLANQYAAAATQPATSPAQQ